MRGLPASSPRTPRRADPAIELRPTVAGDRDAIIDLLGASLGWEADERARSLFAWKHETNPFGPSYAWVAEHDGRIVAVRLFMRWRFRRGAGTVEAVRAVDTATHPDYQGKGLFRALTLRGIEQCRADGIGFVFNTPNDQSRPGYLTMGWREVGRLATAVRPTGVGDVRTVLTSRVPAERWSEPLTIGQSVDDVAGGRRPDSRSRTSAVGAEDRTLRTDIDDRFRAWRYGIEDLHYRVVETEDRDAAAVIRLRRRGASRELVVVERLGDPDAADRLAVRHGGQRRRQPRHPARCAQPAAWVRPAARWRAGADVASAGRRGPAAVAQLGPGDARHRTVLTPRHGRFAFRMVPCARRAPDLTLRSPVPCRRGRRRSSLAPSDDQGEPDMGLMDKLKGLLRGRETQVKQGIDKTSTPSRARPASTPQGGAGRRAGEGRRRQARQVIRGR